MAKQFGSAAAFNASLEAHLRKRAAERGVPYATLQLKFVIERLLARLFRAADPGWLLKGGFALELRYGWGNRPMQGKFSKHPSSTAPRLCRIVASRCRSCPR